MTEKSRAVDPVALTTMLEMVGGDLEFLDELVDTFLEDAVAQLEAMRAAVSAADPAALVLPAHSMKTNSANMGAAGLAQLCRELEAQARAGSLDGAVERVIAAEKEFEAVRTELLALRVARP
jgi:two-component system, sensor histidine kinase and response regulator